MAETPTIKTSAPAPVPSSGSPPVAPTAPVTPALPTTLNEAPVLTAPPALILPQVRVQETGVVIANNPQTQQITIQTPQGNVLIQSPTSLPLDAPVILEFYTDNTQTRANISILKQEAQTTQEPQVAAPVPPPPMKEGQTVVAIMLPRSPQTYAIDRDMKMPLPNSLSEGEDAIESSIPKAPMSTSSLPPGDSPGEGKLSPAQKHVNPYQTQTISNMPDSWEENLVQITRSPLHAKAPDPAPETKQTPAFPIPLNKTIDTLITVAQNIRSQPDMTPFSTLMPQAAPPPVPQNMYQMKIIRIFPPETLPEQIKTVLQDSKLPDLQMAKVEAFTASAAPLLKTAGGDHFVVRTPAAVEAGSTIVFKTSPMTAEQLMQNVDEPLIPTGDPVSRTQGTSRFDPRTSETWPALQEGLQTLKHAAPAVAQAAHQTIPTPTQQMVPTALFFMAALRLGTIENWLGPNTLQALRDIGRKNLADSLTDDFAKLSQQSKTPLTDEWKSLSIPLMHDEQLSQMQLYIRHQHDQQQSGKDDKEKPATRFIMNLHMSRMGDLQLDGYIHKKKFDVILRTQEKLPFDMRQELMQRFAAALEQTNMQGGISFQTKVQSWVTVELPRQSGTFI